MINIYFDEADIAINQCAIEMIHMRDNQIEIYMISDTGVLIVKGDRQKLVKVYRDLVMGKSDIDARGLEYTYVG